ncbi:MAG TPA: DUF3857 domain-containing protein, partial [Chitinophagaceae bacterium]|nr:DUF3857 domain-containing protein [Chitinophagaceae bacterium]
MRTLFFLLLFFWVADSPAQSSLLSLSAASAPVPDSLKAGADAVYRLNEQVIDIHSPSRFTWKVRQVIALLTPNAGYLLKQRLSTDKFYKVTDVRIIVYDAAGNEWKRFSRKDFSLAAAYDGISLITDDKVLSFDVPTPGTPCTLEVQYTYEVTGYISLPDTYLAQPKRGTELFRCTVSVPAELDIRYRSRNIGIKPEVRSEGNRKVYTWEAQGLKPAKVEADGFAATKYLPVLELEPNAFDYDGYKGTFRSWKEFGAWSYPFYVEEAPFAPNRVQEIRDLVKDKEGRREKAEALYAYLQQNMRYVSIQLGIGGFKPFTARFVDEKKYGDCKALTNYMKHLLATVGITAHPALVNAGYDEVPVDPSFPSNKFNHVVLCVPDGKDTLWLECTAKTGRPGFLGAWTENRNALLLTPSGGILVRTPDSRPEDSRLVSRNRIRWNTEGAADVETTLFGTGKYFTDLYQFSEGTSSDRIEFLTGQFLFAVPEEWSFGSLSDSANGATIPALLQYEKGYSFKAGTKFFVSPRINGFLDTELQLARRDQDYLFSYPFEKTDTTVYQLPPNFSVEQLPPDQSISDAWVQYQRTSTADAVTRTVTITTRLRLVRHIIPGPAYEGLVHTFQKIREA